VSTGGTAAALREGGIEVTDVAELTGSPEILDGRVKTLHPRLHAALLAVRDDAAHVATLEAEGIEPIDLVCVNLYPFEQTVAGHEVDESEAIENIGDTGGKEPHRAGRKPRGQPDRRMTGLRLSQILLSSFRRHGRQQVNPYICSATTM